ncbi:hypothetical protein [Tardiphaga sp.]|uniref:hypothetical protein n=1 Tax=Tardiphaga sp. TaxID=1926292 RepID=UPI00261A25FC|nr:hypothetical protein [Tardiphaga sp.]MDB5616511.1 hypothetical protein [Tardiphaga sp.]
MQTGRSTTNGFNNDSPPEGQGMERHKRGELVFAGLMKRLMQAGQTHSAYVAVSEDYDAFFPANDDTDRR